MVDRLRESPDDCFYETSPLASDKSRSARFHHPIPPRRFVRVSSARHSTPARPSSGVISYQHWLILWLGVPGVMGAGFSCFKGDTATGATMTDSGGCDDRLDPRKPGYSPYAVDIAQAGDGGPAPQSNVLVPLYIYPNAEAWTPLQQTWVNPQISLVAASPRGFSLALCPIPLRCRRCRWCQVMVVIIGVGSAWLASMLQ
jgi:hypothetical protein